MRERIESQMPDAYANRICNVRTDVRTKNPHPHNSQVSVADAGARVTDSRDEGDPTTLRDAIAGVPDDINRDCA